MKMRTVRLTPRFFLEALRGKTSITNFPDDVQLLDLKFDLWSNQIFAVIRSESFEDIAERFPIPDFKSAYTESSDNKIQRQNIPEVEVRTFAQNNNEPTKKVQVQLNPLVNDVAQEFTPEQRKILSFKVEDERVIVKPVQFLKAEWNDINEVVKSLGGRWVKGDIASYWEIQK